MRWHPKEGSAAPAKDHRRESVVLTFYWLLVLMYAYFIPPILDWNTESHLYPAFAMVDHHTLKIDRYHIALGDKSYYKGHYYSDKAPGLAFLAVPAYAGIRLVFPNIKGRGYWKYGDVGYGITRDIFFIRYAITYLWVVLPSAGLALLIWLFLTRVTASAGWSLLTTAAYSLGTTAYVYSTWFFSHQLAATLLFSAFTLMFWFVRDKPPDRRVFLATGLAGALTGYSIISEYPTALVAFLLGVYLLFVSRSRWLTATSFVAGMIPPALLLLAYNLVAFGRPFATGYVYSTYKHASRHIRAGPLGLTSPASYGVRLPTLDSLWQITFGPYRGIFLVAPVLLLFFVGLAFMWRRTDLRREFWLCAVVIIAYFVLDASRGADQTGWSGGSSVASRHLVPVLPFMIIPIAFGFVNRFFRIAFLTLGTISMVMMFLVISTISLFSFEQQNPLIHELLPHIVKGRFEVSWGTILLNSMGVKHYPSVLPPLALLVLASLLALRIVWLFRSREHLFLPAEGNALEQEAV